MAQENGSDFYISPQAAVIKQRSLRGKIILEPLKKQVETVAGADISYNIGSDELYAGFVVLRLPDLKVVARSLAREIVNFPYIPGLLAFREIPALMKAWKQLKIKPDVVILDGHGIAHPRRMGIATHFGILADQPAIGCAKKNLTGKYKEPEKEKGAFEYITEEGVKIGMTFRSRTNVKPIYISPGHRVSFKDSRSIIQQCLTKYKLPETTRQAHRVVNEFRKGEVEAGYWENKESGLSG